MKAPMTVPTGEALPAFEGRMLRDGRRIGAQALDGQAAVLLFFAPECKDCKVRIAEISAMYPSMRAAGVGIWVVSAHSTRRLRVFLKDTPLLDHVLRVRASTLRALNPRQAAPFYIFIDHTRTVLASNFIGDEDWSSFCRQMREADRHRAAPPTPDDGIEPQGIAVAS
jgi:hypothetical protein